MEVIRDSDYLDHFVPLVHILDTELGICGTAIIVFHDRVTYINRISGLDVVKEMGHIEAYRRDVVIRM